MRYINAPLNVVQKRTVASFFKKEFFFFTKTNYKCLPSDASSLSLSQWYLNTYYQTDGLDKHNSNIFVVPRRIPFGRRTSRRIPSRPVRTRPIRVSYILIGERTVVASCVYIYQLFLERPSWKPVDYRNLKQKGAVHMKANFLSHKKWFVTQTAAFLLFRVSLFGIFFKKFLPCVVPALVPQHQIDMIMRNAPGLPVVEHVNRNGGGW